MTTSRPRIVAGIVAACLIAAMGPVMQALAIQSGNVAVQSGNTPAIPGPAGARDDSFLHVRNQATADWYKNGSSFHIDVTRGRNTDTRADAARYSASESYDLSVNAWIQTCSQSGCKTREWHDGAYDHRLYPLGEFFLQEEFSYFWGTLYGPDGKSCIFDVSWSPKTPRNVPPYPPRSESTSVDPNGVSAERRFVVAQNADAHVTAPCWGTLESKDLQRAETSYDFVAKADAGRTGTP